MIKGQTSAGLCQRNGVLDLGDSQLAWFWVRSRKNIGADSSPDSRPSFEVGFKDGGRKWWWLYARSKGQVVLSYRIVRVHLATADFHLRLQVEVSMIRNFGGVSYLVIFPSG